jgi:hypothetical protein
MWFVSTCEDTQRLFIFTGTLAHDLHGYLECFIVLVTTGFTLCHGMALLTEHCTLSEDWSNAHAKGAADRVSCLVGEFIC